MTTPGLGMIPRESLPHNGLALLLVYVREMKSKTWIMATAGPLVLGIISTAAQAVPITNSVADLRTAATADPPWSRPPSATAGGTMGGDTACGMAGHERTAILAGTINMTRPAALR